MPGLTINAHKSTDSRRVRVRKVSLFSASIFPSGVRVVDLDTQLRLFSLSAGMNPLSVVAAAAAGDVANLRNLLMKQPSEV